MYILLVIYTQKGTQRSKGYPGTQSMQNCGTQGSDVLVFTLVLFSYALCPYKSEECEKQSSRKQASHTVESTIVPFGSGNLTESA